MKVIEDTILTSSTGEGTSTLCGHPSHLKVQLFAGQSSTLLGFPLNESENGLVVPRKFTAFTKSEKKLKEEITHKKELFKHVMDTEITGSDLTEKKLFSHTDSAIVEA